MSDPKQGRPIPESVADAGVAEEFDVTEPRRGAPKKSPDQKLTHILRLSFTKDQYFALLEHAAKKKVTLEVFAKRLLLGLLEPEEKP